MRFTIAIAALLATTTYAMKIESSSSNSLSTVMDIEAPVLVQKLTKEERNAKKALRKEARHAVN